MQLYLYRGERRSIVFVGLRFVCLVFVFGLALSGAMLRAQDSAPKATQDDRGLTVPVGVEPKPGEGRRVVVSNLAGEPVVAKIYLDMQQRYIVLLPDGRLISAPVDEAAATDRPFQPLSKDALAEQLTSGSFKGFKSKSTARFVYVYDGRVSDEFYRATHSILETMYPSLENWCKRAGLAVHDAEAPLVVIMFRDQAQFQHYWDGPEGMRAFYNPLNNFIVMYEPEAGSPAAQLTYNLIAHEGAHQILANLGVQKRLSRWPLWFVEGLAEYFAPTETGRRIRWQGVGSINPVRRSEFFAAAGRGAAGGALVRETVSATGVDLSFYSKSWALVHYLAQKRPKEFNAYLAEVSKLEGYAPAPDGPTLFAKHFGDDFAALQTGLLRHLQSAR